MRNKTTIDPTDEAILRILLEESRTSFTEIADTCKISVAAARKRYQRLCKAGIITGGIIQVNPQSLGYKCVSTIGITTTKQDENEVIEFLKSKPYMTTVFPNIFEKANIGTIVTVRDVQELTEALQEIEANPKIKNTLTLIWTKSSGFDHPENIVLSPSAAKTKLLKPPQKHNTTSLDKAKIDETDIQIIKILKGNSRIPFARIAEELNISTKNVIQRYKMLRGTVLARSTVTVSLEKIGFKAMAHLSIKTKRKEKPEILAKLRKIPNLIVEIEHIGNYDVFLIVVLRNFEDFFKLEERIHQIHGIEEVDAFLNTPYKEWPLNLFASLL